MKILIYSHYFAPSIGGVESAVLSLARGLVELRSTDNVQEFEVTVTTQTAVGSFNDQVLPFRVVRRPTWFQLWRLIRAADLVHLAGPAFVPLALAWLTGKRVVVEHHGYQAICPNGGLVHLPDRSMCPGHFQAANYGECLRCQNCETSVVDSFLRLLLLFPRVWLARRVAANLTISEHVLKRVAMPRSLVVYYGVEESHPYGERVPPSFNGSGKICFAYVGRLVSEKGAALLLKAAKQLRSEGRQFIIRLIGDGPERENLEQLIDSAGLRDCARITGYLNGAALDDAVRDVAVMVMPSVCEETAGLAAIEQMMRGRLVIAADIGGLSEVVGETGLRFPLGDAVALADRMREVLREPSIIDSYGQQARQRAIRLFRRQRMIEQHADVYRRLRATLEPDEAEAA